MAFSLATDERSIWQGAPAQGIHFSPQDIFAIPFSIFWLGMVSFMAVMVVSDKAQNVDPMTYFIFPIFLIVGLYMAVGRFFVDIAVRRNTAYVLTNRRAIVESGLFRKGMRSINLAATSEVNFRPGRNGRGTIEFGSSAGPFGMLPRSWPGAGRFLAPAFDGVEEGQHVYDLVLKAQRESQRT